MTDVHEPTDATLARPYEYRGVTLASLGVPDEPATPHRQWEALVPTAAAEAVRSAVWAASGVEVRQPEQGVHILRVINLAVRMVRPLAVDGASDGTLRSLCVDVLDDLERLGDLARLPGGRWLPTPTRAIALDIAQEWLVVGGMPSARLRSVVPGLTQIGLARTCGAPPAGMYRQTLAEWLRTPDARLREWLTQVTSAASWMPFEGALEEYEVYVPRNGRFQSQRWQGLETRVGKATALLRRNQAGPVGTYLLGRFTRGRLADTWSLPNRIDARRLCYAFDDESRCPTEAAVAASTPLVSIILRDSIPSAEFRLFTALARIEPNPNGRAYPRVWRVRPAHVGELVAALQALEIRLVWPSSPTAQDESLRRELGLV